MPLLLQALAWINKWMNENGFVWLPQWHLRPFSISHVFFMCIWAYVHVVICVYMFMCLYVYLCARVYMCICVHVFMCVKWHMCAYIYVYMGICVYVHDQKNAMMFHLFYQCVQCMQMHICL